MNWIIFALLSATNTALATVLIKIGLNSQVNPLLVALMQTSISTVFVLFYIFLSKEKILSTLTLMPKQALMMTALSGIATAFAWVFYITALKKGPALHVATIDRMNILLVVIFCVAFLGECFRYTHLVGALCIVFGAFLLIR